MIQVGGDIERVIAAVRKALTDPRTKDWEADFQGGMTSVYEPGQQYVKYEDNGTRTIVIRINGGAREDQRSELGLPRRAVW